MRFYGLRTPPPKQQIWVTDSQYSYKLYMWVEYIVSLLLSKFSPDFKDVDQYTNTT